MDFHPLYDDLFSFMQTNKLNSWLESLVPLLRHKLQEKPHGDLSRWLDAFHDLPDIQAEEVNLNHSAISASNKVPLCSEIQEKLRDALFRLSPWRKGPFELFNIYRY